MLQDTQVISHDLGDLDTATIHILADVHIGAEEADAFAFEQLVLRIASTPGHFAILAGDLIDNGIKSSVTNVYRATMRPGEQKREMTRILEPLRDRILCLIPGNHCFRTSKEVDDDPCYDIASKLDLEDLYRENIGILRLQVGIDHRNTRSGIQRRRVYYAGVVHGAGGGAMLGATVNRNDAFMGGMDNLDILVTAHCHKQYVHLGSKFWVDRANGVVTQRPYLVISAGSWLRYGGYAARKQLRPVSMPGTDRLVLYGNEHKFEGIV